MIHPVRLATDFLDARQKRRWLLLVPLAVTAAFFEAAGTMVIFGLVQLVIDPTKIGDLPAASFLQGYLPATDAGHSSATATIAAFAGLVALFYVVKNGLRLFEIYARERCTASSEVAISTSMLHGYLAAPYTFHLTRNSSALIRDTTRSAQVVARRVLCAATTVVSNTLVVVGVASVVVVSAPGVALGACLVMGGLMMGLLRFTRARSTRWGQQIHQLEAEILQNVQQSLEGVKEIKVLGRSSFFERLFARKKAAFTRLQVRQMTIEGTPKIVMETLFITGVAAMVVFAQAQGVTELAPLIGLFAYAGLRILPSLQLIVNRLNGIRFATSPIESIHADWVALKQSETGSTAADSAPLPFARNIVLEGVSYTYPEAERAALSELQLTICRGDSIGIVGTTGAGKTTLLDLLLGLLDPTEGRICVDGVDIAPSLPAWQAQIGYVPQNIYLTDDSIRRNIALGLDDPEIDDTRLWKAARIARIDEVIEALPEGLDTVVGERGVRLSGGQRQRIALARALYRDASVLVFDEATAALDNQTEREVSREISSLQRKKTLIIVAHRLSTVRNCDRIVLLRDGGIEDVGTYDELIERSKTFRELAGSSPQPMR